MLGTKAYLFLQTLPDGAAEYEPKELGNKSQQQGKLVFVEVETEDDPVDKNNRAKSVIQDYKQSILAEDVVKNTDILLDDPKGMDGMECFNATRQH